MATKKRIWYQSFVDPQAHANYINYLQSYLNEYAEEGFVFEVHGMSPPDKNFHPLTELRCGIQTIYNAIQAEKQHYSAFVIGHFQEPGIHEIKACIDIPVIGLGETTMLYACQLGQKIGLVTINPVFIPWHQNQITNYGLQERIVAVKAINAEALQFEKAFFDAQRYQKIRNDFIDQVKPMLDQGIEVVIPAGGLPMLLFAKEKTLMLEDAVLLNGISVCVKMTEAAIKLNELTGIQVSRRIRFKKPNQETIQEFMSIINLNK